MAQVQEMEGRTESVPGERAEAQVNDRQEFFTVENIKYIIKEDIPPILMALYLLHFFEVWTR